MLTAPFLYICCGPADSSSESLSDSDRLKHIILGLNPLFRLTSSDRQWALSNPVPHQTFWVRDKQEICYRQCYNSKPKYTHFWSVPALTGDFSAEQIKVIKPNLNHCQTLKPFSIWITTFKQTTCTLLIHFVIWNQSSCIISPRLPRPLCPPHLHAVLLWITA